MVGKKSISTHVAAAFVIKSLEARRMLASATFVYDLPAGSGTPHKLVISLDETVPAGAFLVLTNLTNGQPITTSEAVSGSTATFTFPSYSNGMTSGVLPDGNYYGVLVDPSQSPGSDVLITTDFFVLTADANHDRTVNSEDFNALAANYGGTGKTYSQGDFSYDGTVNALDFNALATNYGEVLAAPSTGLELAGFVDPSDDQAKLWWTQYAGAADYTVDISLDGTTIMSTIDTHSTDYAAYLEDFEAAEQGQNYYFRINALDGSSNVLSSSNFIDLLPPDDGSGSASAPAESASPSFATPATATKIVYAVNGAYPIGGNILDPIGNQWFEKMIEDTGDSVKSGSIKTYQDQFPKRGLEDLLATIDQDHNLTITASEEAQFDIVFAGYSWGSNSVINMSRLVRAHKIGFEDSNVYTLDAALPISLLITIDPIINGPLGFARLLKPVWYSGVLGNVNRLVNYYQRRGGNTTVDLYEPGSTGNGSSVNPFLQVGTDPITPEFGGPLEGDMVPNALDPSKVVQENVSSFGRYATNVEYFKDPLSPDLYGSENWFDGILAGNQVQHDMMPYWVRGGVDPSYPTDVNWGYEFDNA